MPSLTVMAATPVTLPVFRVPLPFLARRFLPLSDERVPSAVKVVLAGTSMLPPLVSSCMGCEPVKLTFTRSVPPFILMALATPPRAPNSAPVALPRLLTVRIPSVRVVVPLKRFTLLMMVSAVPFFSMLQGPTILSPLRV